MAGVRVGAVLSEEAKRGFDAFCRAEGVTFTGLLEASGKWLDEHRATPDSDAVRAIIDQARAVDAERARRR